MCLQTVETLELLYLVRFIWYAAGDIEEDDVTRDVTLAEHVTPSSDNVIVIQSLPSYDDNNDVSCHDDASGPRDVITLTSRDDAERAVSVERQLYASESSSSSSHGSDSGGVIELTAADNDEAQRLSVVDADWLQVEHESDSSSQDGIDKTRRQDDAQPQPGCDADSDLGVTSRRIEELDDEVTTQQVSLRSTGTADRLR